MVFRRESARCSDRKTALRFELACVREAVTRMNTTLAKAVATGGAAPGGDPVSQPAPPSAEEATAKTASAKQPKSASGKAAGSGAGKAGGKKKAAATLHSTASLPSDGPPPPDAPTLN